MHTTNLSERQAARLLAETSPEGLLRTFAALTHRIHNAERPDSPRHPEWGANVARLREQRDRVQAELLRRMGA